LRFKNLLGKKFCRRTRMGQGRFTPQLKNEDNLCCNKNKSPSREEQ
jgi:hypothetical protein